MSLVAMGASMAGCSNEDENLNQPAVKSDKLIVEACLQNNDGDTKAPISAWTAGNSMGLFVKSSGLTGDDYGEVNGQVQAVYNNVAWTVSPEVSLSSTPANVYAYFPYDANVTDGTAVPVEVASQTDYLYSGNAISASASNAKVSLQMKHALCVFAFSVKNNGYIGGEGKLTSIVFKNGAGIDTKLFASKGTMDISTGNIRNLVYDDYTLVTDKTITGNGWGIGEQPLALVLPFQTGSSSQPTFVFTVDGKEYEVAVPKNMSYNAGEQYLFRLTINSTSMELDAANITIVPWGDQTGVDLDDVMTKVKGLTYTLTTITAGESHNVANVGSVNGTIDWGDSSVEESYSATKSHSYASVGTYNVQIQAEDEINTVTVSNIEGIEEMDFSQIV